MALEVSLSRYSFKYSISEIRLKYLSAPTSEGTKSSSTSSTSNQTVEENSSSIKAISEAIAREQTAAKNGSRSGCLDTHQGQLMKSASEGRGSNTTLSISNQIVEESSSLSKKATSKSIEGEQIVAKNSSRSASPDSPITPSTKSVSERTKSGPILSECSMTGEKSSLSSIKSIPKPKSREPTAAKTNPTPVKEGSGTKRNNPIVSKAHSSSPENTSILNQNNSITTDSSSGLARRSDPPIHDGMPTFWANYIHDLESIWWILIWTLLTYHKTGNDNYTPDTTIETQQRFLAAEKLFHVNDYYLDRLMHLEERDSFNEIAEAIPSFFKGLVEVAAVFREKLVLTYLEEEGKSVFPIKLMDDGLLHRDILEAFRTSPIESFDVAYIFTKNKAATKLTTDPDETSKSSKRPTCENDDEGRPFKRAR